MSQTDKTHVLIVDDSATIRNVISKHLGDAFITVHACNGKEAWQLLESNDDISLIFADLHMPVMNGMMLLQQIRKSDCEHISSLPVIMITGHEDSEGAKQASFNMGATDFITKPFSAVDIVTRAGAYAKLSQKIATLEQNVSHDPLTDLFNKDGLQELGDKAVAGAYRHHFELSVLAMQVANTDELMAKHGEKITEQIILSVANTLKKTLRQEDSLAHIGSGQFVLLLPMTKVFRAHIVADRFQKAVDNLAFQAAEEVIRIKLASALNSTEGYSEQVSFTEILSKAEKALQASLQSRTFKVVSYNESLLEKPQGDKNKKSSAVTTKKEVPAKESVTELQKLDTAEFNRYMSAILNDDFGVVPAQHIENMIEPLESFLKYAYIQMQTGNVGEASN